MDTKDKTKLRALLAEVKATGGPKKYLGSTPWIFEMGNNMRGSDDMDEKRGKGKPLSLL